MLRTQVQFTDEQVRSLRREAAARGVSIAEVVREAVDSHLRRQTAGARRERAVRAVGGFRSGLRDVSERHDDHLAEALAE